MRRSPRVTRRSGATANIAFSKSALDELGKLREHLLPRVRIVKPQRRVARRAPGTPSATARRTRTARRKSRAASGYVQLGASR